jgi:hypothetical protein
MYNLDFNKSWERDYESDFKPSRRYDREISYQPQESDQGWSNISIKAGQ